MIVGNRFPGDTNEALKWIQHDLYKELLPELVRLPRRRYLRAAQLVGVQDETTSALKTLETFDPRVLQASHDAIAAYFRFAHDRRGQLPLPIHTLSYPALLEKRWRDFYHREVARLTENDTFVRAILAAVLHPNTSEGYTAE